MCQPERGKKDKARTWCRPIGYLAEDGVSGTECRDGESSALRMVCSCRPMVLLETVDESGGERQQGLGRGLSNVCLDARVESSWKLTFALRDGPITGIAGLWVLVRPDGALLGGRQTAGQRGDRGQRLTVRHGSWLRGALVRNSVHGDRRRVGGVGFAQRRRVQRACGGRVVQSAAVTAAAAAAAAVVGRWPMMCSSAEVGAKL